MYSTYKYWPNTDPVWVDGLLPDQYVLVRTMYIFTYKYVLIHTICIMVYVSCTYYMYIYIKYRILPDQYVFVCNLYIYMYMNTYRYIHSGAEDLRLSRRSREQVVRHMQSEPEAGLEPQLLVLSKGHSDVKTKKGSHPAKAYIGPLQKEERAWLTACQQFMAEQDFCTGKNVVLPFPSAKEERYSTL